MPTYDYRCDHCGHTFSAAQSFHDEPLEVCPNCGKRPRRLISASSIVFKGSGWYKTDSRASTVGSDGDSGKAEKTEKKVESPSAKTDAPAATKAEPKKTSGPAGGGGSSS